jgi:mono/diheme cytochrome c family protein
MSRRARLVLVPAILFAAVSLTVYVLAELHPAKDAAPQAQGQTPSGTADAARGETLFADNCVSCHGAGGVGGGVGPTLAGSGVSVEDARATIESGSGVMPPGLVSGQDLEDVLAYLEDVLGS